MTDAIKEDEKVKTYRVYFQARPYFSGHLDVEARSAKGAEEFAHWREVEGQGGWGELDWSNHEVELVEVKEIDPSEVDTE